jgi:hypothetical protein
MVPIRRNVPKVKFIMHPCVVEVFQLSLLTLQQKMAHEIEHQQNDFI